MNKAMKQQIISELDSLPDQKAYSLLDYLHFLKQEPLHHIPNQDTIDAIREVEDHQNQLPSYSSSDELFDDLGIEA